MKIVNWILITGLGVALSLSACNRQPLYTIEGTIEESGYEGKKVVLIQSELSKNGPFRSDTAIVINGRYSFKGKIEQPECYDIWIAPYSRNTIYIHFVLDNADIKIHTDAEGESSVSGTADNERYQEFKETKKTLSQKLRTTYSTLRTAKAAEPLTKEQESKLKEEENNCRQEIEKFTFEFVKKNINNPISLIELYNCITVMSEEKQQELFSGANERTLKLPVVEKVQGKIRALRQTAVGQPFTDFQMTDPDGQEIALSDYAGKGKYVLVDFWASWCKGCVAEIPSIKAEYAKYKDRGLQVVGVSLDANREAWLKALNKLDTPWPQMFDARGWECDAAQAYGFSSIPQLVLLDPDGKIIARNIHGEELQRKLAEVPK